jgi:hypothetical protein
MKNFRNFRDDRFALTTPQNPLTELHNIDEIIRAMRQTRDDELRADQRRKAQALAAPVSAPVEAAATQMPETQPLAAANPDLHPAPASPAVSSPPASPPAAKELAAVITRFLDAKGQQIHMPAGTYDVRVIYPDDPEPEVPPEVREKLRQEVRQELLEAACAAAREAILEAEHEKVPEEVREAVNEEVRGEVQQLAPAPVPPVLLEPQPPQEEPAPKPRRQKRRRPRRPKISVDESSLTALERHSRKCAICHHPDREEIEEDYLDWENSEVIAKAFELSGYRSIYRHARATGLRQQRRENLSLAAEYMVEHALGAAPSPQVILGAIRTAAHINSCGQWSRPPAHVVVSSGGRVVAAHHGLASSISVTEVLPPAIAPAQIAQLPAPMVPVANPFPELTEGLQLHVPPNSDAEFPDSPNALEGGETQPFLIDRAAIRK